MEVCLGFQYFVNQFKFVQHREIWDVGRQPTVSQHFLRYCRFHSVFFLRFTVRNVTFNGVNTAVFAMWNWGMRLSFEFHFQTAVLISVIGWTFQGVTINNCQVGFDLMTGGKTLGRQVGVLSLFCRG